MRQLEGSDNCPPQQRNRQVQRLGLARLRAALWRRRHQPCAGGFFDSNEATAFNGIDDWLHVFKTRNTFMIRLCCGKCGREWPRESLANLAGRVSSAVSGAQSSFSLQYLNTARRVQAWFIMSSTFAAGALLRIASVATPARARLTVTGIAAAEAEAAAVAAACMRRRPAASDT